MGSLVVLPVVFLMIGQMSGLFLLNTAFVFAMGLVLWVINVLLFLAGAATFRRGELMARLS
jgi:hypothetical protein